MTKRSVLENHTVFIWSRPAAPGKFYSFEDPKAGDTLFADETITGMLEYYSAPNCTIEFDGAEYRGWDGHALEALYPHLESVLTIN